MKRIFILLLSAALGQICLGQGTFKNDFRAGLGISLLGSGDMRCAMFENEFNHQFGKRFGYGISAGMGRSDDGVWVSSSFGQLGANLYYSPSKPDGKNSLRIGTGFNLYKVSDVWRSSALYNSQGELIEAEYAVDQRNSAGINVVIEYQHNLNERIFGGLKLFTTPYFNGDINSGIQLRMGFRL